MDTMNQNDREESNVEEMEGVTTDEQSAAWREVARDAVLRAKPGYAIADIRARFDALAKEVQANG